MVNRNDKLTMTLEGIRHKLKELGIAKNYVMDKEPSRESLGIYEQALIDYLNKNLESGQFSSEGVELEKDKVVVKIVYNCDHQTD